MFLWDSPIMQLLSSLTCTGPRAVPCPSIRPGCKGTCTAPGTQQGSQRLAGLQGPRLHLTKSLLAMPLTTQSLCTARASLCLQICPPTMSHWQHGSSGNAKTIGWPHLLWMQRMPQRDSPGTLCSSTAPRKAQPVAWAQAEKGLLPQGDSSSDLSSLLAFVSAGNVAADSCSSILH